jgi:predicted ArsR family transcriptional regulator
MTDQPLLDWVPHNGTDTSRDAAESMRPHVSHIEERLMKFITYYGSATCDEVEVNMTITHQTASARLKGLADKGLIKDSGARRPTRRGRAARVYVAT